MRTDRVLFYGEKTYKKNEKRIPYRANSPLPTQKLRVGDKPRIHSNAREVTSLRLVFTTWHKPRL